MTEYDRLLLLTIMQDAEAEGRQDAADAIRAEIAEDAAAEDARLDAEAVALMSSAPVSVEPETRTEEDFQVERGLIFDRLPESRHHRRYTRRLAASAAAALVGETLGPSEG